jgi:mRNA-degrading endonuclease RelE of RelBE toxin-antitoxin system
MAWQLRIAKQAAKKLARVPRKDRERIAVALAEMRESAFRGDIARLKNESAAWRRRVGNYRIFFDVDMEERCVDVIDIRRRTTTTYG